MIIDATNLILGRLASFAAKKSLLGETIEIINCENTVISGRNLVEKYLIKQKRGTHKGPFFPRQAHMLVKRTIRGMLPYKQYRGKQALGRIQCHIGKPDSITGKAETLKEIDVTQLGIPYFMSVGKICEQLGGK
ncbi:MAG TPA: 50S ribosomal protein L13 [Candidatus Nanoarchaeia archaeon]|nr:50S ribosomal protein L13 [Candidatus Nanoarchaeia archaeon]